MFPHRYFTTVFFPDRFWAKHGAGATIETTGAPTGEVSVFSATTCTVSIYTYSQADAQVTA